MKAPTPAWSCLDGLADLLGSAQQLHSEQPRLLAVAASVLLAFCQVRPKNASSAARGSIACRVLGSAQQLHSEQLRLLAVAASVILAFCLVS